MSGIEGAVAVVTGASRGVGRDVAEVLATRGAQVIRVARTAERFCVDVRDPTQVAELAKEVEEEFGRPTILVNAAGMFGPLERFRDTDPAAWIETLVVDAIGPYLTCRAFVGGMLEMGWGRIVNVSSAAALSPPTAIASAYATAKSALNQLTRHLAADVEGTGVTANVIHPGDVRTAMWAEIHLDPSRSERLRAVERRCRIRQRDPRASRLQELDRRQAAARSADHGDLFSANTEGLAHHRTFNVARLNSAKMIARIRNRVITFGSAHPMSSK